MLTVNPKTHLIDTLPKLPVGSLTGGLPMPIRRLLVIHYTEGGAARTSAGWWNQPQNRRKDLGAHFLIERDGTTYQCRATNRTISHAGTSRWRDPKTGILYRNLNSCSISIELCNTGDECDTIKGEEQLRGYAGTLVARHRNESTKSKPRRWEKFSDAQISACWSLSRALIDFYHLDDVTGHDCIAPERKLDPGPAFPMADFRHGLGFSGLPTVLWR
jgi:N-acetylmuramoyl-L-alanine amidase